MQKVQDKPGQAATSLKFFDWAYKNGDATAANLDYVPMPEGVKKTVLLSWKAIKDTAGKGISIK